VAQTSARRRLYNSLSRSRFQVLLNSLHVLFQLSVTVLVRFWVPAAIGADGLLFQGAELWSKFRLICARHNIQCCILGTHEIAATRRVWKWNYYMVTFVVLCFASELASTYTIRCRHRKRKRQVWEADRWIIEIIYCVVCRLAVLEDISDLQSVVCLFFPPVVLDFYA